MKNENEPRAITLPIDTARTWSVVALTDDAPLSPVETPTSYPTCTIQAGTYESHRTAGRHRILMTYSVPITRQVFSPSDARQLAEILLHYAFIAEQSEEH